MNDRPTNPYVPDPRHLRDATLHELVAGYVDHRAALVNARHGIGRPEPIGRLRGSALDALAVAAAITEQLVAERWITVLDALDRGASVADVAVAMGGLDQIEVTTGLRSWADGQLRLHHDAGGQLGITPAEHEAVYALLAGHLTAEEIRQLDAAADERLGADDDAVER